MASPVHLQSLARYVSDGSLLQGGHDDACALLKRTGRRVIVQRASAGTLSTSNRMRTPSDA